ncbi:hypothetical protein LWI28_002541 [Acer negundo]|uniref:Uncharacterized protein n=1 Tax=Acer negundo TaxID=4023 RepID=A0AAD5JI19_ACENE|nr:hypothetical protein LWI28_002541 [Acer negundo]
MEPCFYDSVTKMLQIFASEVISALAREFATRRNANSFPSIMKWEFTRRPPLDKVKKIMKDRMFVEPEITPTNQKVARWYYEGLQNMDDLYRAPGALDNMPNEYEDGHSTGNLTPPRSRLPSAAGPSGIATPTPTPTKGVADIPTPPGQRFRAGTI